MQFYEKDGKGREHRADKNESLTIHDTNFYHWPTQSYDIWNVLNIRKLELRAMFFSIMWEI